MILALGLAFVSCKSKMASDSSSALLVKQKASRVKIQHVLISFGDLLPGKTIQRTLEEAEKLAQEVLKKSKLPGADFEALVKEYSDDRAPGIYFLSDRGQELEGDDIPRDQMVKDFGDMSFSLNVNEVGLVMYNKESSPFGFHVIKRLE